MQVQKYERTDVSDVDTETSGINHQGFNDNLTGKYSLNVSSSH